MKCRLTACSRFSIFFENAFVNRVKRLMLIRIVRFCLSTYDVLTCLGVGIAGPPLFARPYARWRAVSLPCIGRFSIEFDERGKIDITTMREIGNEARQETGRRLDNRDENSHQPFRRQERAMAKFRSEKSLQKFVAVHASFHNHFNLERHLCNRQDFKLNRAAALDEWRQLAA